jgi:hypothetical protein
MHSLKTAGSSLTIEISKYLSEDDILSIDEYVLDDFRVADIVPKGFFNRNKVATLGREGFISASKYMESVLNYGTFLNNEFDMSPRKFFNYYNKSSLAVKGLGLHARALKVKRSYPGEWGNYFKFSFERNPWDRMLSLYSWRWRGVINRPNFDDFIISMMQSKEAQKNFRSYSFSNLSIYSINDLPAMDYMGRYESLKEDMNIIFKNINLPEPGELTFSKSGIRSKMKFIEFISDKSDCIIRDIFSKEIKIFNYERPASLPREMLRPGN